MKPSSTISARAGTCSCRRRRQALRQLGACAAQQAGELVFGQRVRHRRHGAEDRRRIGAQHHRHRIRLARIGERELAEIERAAAMREPAHDQLVAADHLLPVDAEVLARLVRPARDGQAPGDQRPGVARPAGLDRQPRQVDVLAFPHDFLAGRRAHGLRRHVPHGLRERSSLPASLSPFGGSGSFSADSSRPTSRSDSSAAYR